MINVMLDPLPDEYEGLKLNTDFRIGIQIALVFDDTELTEEEQLTYAMQLLFMNPEEIENLETIMEVINWFLNDWNHDNHTSSDNKTKVLDFDIDQWRIHSAFLHYYQIDLRTQDLHFWEFMGLLSNIGECTLTHIMDIRDKKPDKHMGNEQRKQLTKAKGIYSLQKKEANGAIDDAVAKTAVAGFLEQQGLL